ncbi:glycoside hydrolase family 2 TIM barrel-domain containing protein [Mucisphaera sp.]|uniref:glycoside hydrolase family 2 protein n=1 Tax=Mucisphaera sp. TaxID=2913024 RepID=UPI003D1300F2
MNTSSNKSVTAFIHGQDASHTYLARLLLVLLLILAPSELSAQHASPATLPDVEQLDFNNPVDQTSTANQRAETAASRMGPNTVEALPYIRLTPRTLDIPGIANNRLSLNGTWDFIHEVPATFDGSGDSASDWQKVNIPGHFAFQGHPRMHAEFGVPVAYRKSFDVPAGWQDQTVILRFESVDGLTRVWVNGQPVGENDIATLPSEFDITPWIKPGQPNEITLTVETSLVTYWSRRELGGINRNVYLQALPQTHLSRLQVDADVEDGKPATLNVHLAITNDADEPATQRRLGFTVTDDTASKNPVRLLDASEIMLPPIAPRQTMHLTVPLKAENVRQWTAETPHLYHITAMLSQNNNGSDTPTRIMSASQRFGFRTIEVVGYELRLNDRPVKLRGTNYHITYPELGEAVPKEIIRKDLELFQYVNFNALRSRPTPDIAYVDLCDEMGIYTTVEAMVTLMIYARGITRDHGANPDIAPGYRNHVATMIENYYSNPSVIAWGLANECPYYDWFRTAAPGMKHRDRTRPLFFGSDRREGVSIPHMDLNDDHYPRDEQNPEGPHYGIGDTEDPTTIRGLAWDYPDDRPNIFTEWMGIPGEPTKETEFDPGIYDFWAHIADTHIEALYRFPHFAGGFHFKGAPYIGAKEVSWGGVFDAHRNLNDLSWHVRKTHAPVRIFNTRGVRDETSQHARFEVANRYDFLDLNQLTFRWRHVDDQKGEAHVEAPARTTGHLFIPMTSSQMHRVNMQIIDPTGRTIDELNLTIPASDEVRREQRREQQRAARKKAEASIEPPPTYAERYGHWIIQAGQTEIHIDQTTGLLTSASIEVNQENATILDGSPTLLVLPSLRRNFRNQGEAALTNQATDWQARHVTLLEQPDRIAVIAQGGYTSAQGTFITSLHHDGRIEINYAFVWTSLANLELFSAGLGLQAGPSFNSLHWDRRARWTDYPEHHIGRAAGVASAAGHPRWNEAQIIAAQTPKDQPMPDIPWSQILAADGVTRDFRSTKFNIYTAGLFDEAGHGVRIIGDGHGLHAQALPSTDGDGYTLHVLNFHRGGSSPHITKSIRFDQKELRPGESFSGKVVLELARPE